MTWQDQKAAEKEQVGVRESPEIMSQEKIGWVREESEGTGIAAE